MRKKLKIVKDLPSDFTWIDPVNGHVLALGDATDSMTLKRLIKLAGEPQLILSDPPYQLSNEKKITFGGKRKDHYLNEKWDNLNDSQMSKLLNDLCQVTTEVVPGANYWIWTSDWWISDIKRSFRANGVRVWPTYVWCKSNPPNQIRKRCTASACEYLVMSSGDGNYFDLSALPKQRSWWMIDGGESVPAVSPYWVERPVLHHAERIRLDGKKEYVNAAQKPIDLITALIKVGTSESGVVMDLFGGTGTTLLCADKIGRRCIYVDSDPEQLRYAVRRLKGSRNG